MSSKDASKYSKADLEKILQDANKAGGADYLKMIATMELVNRGELPAAQLYDILNQQPDLFDRRDFLASQVKDSLINKVTDTPGTRIVLSKEYEAIEKRLRGAGECSMLEQLLITRACMSWLRLQYAEYYASSVMRGGSFKQCEYAERDLTRAQARFIKAIESLERMRAMVKTNKVLDAQVCEAEARADIMKARMPRPLRLAGSNAG